MIEEFGCQQLPRSGVIYVTTEATKAGFTPDSPDWSNLGQGAPETKPTTINLPTNINSYAPVDGLKELREEIANYYNTLFRKDKKSQYTYKNVSVTPGGRAGLTRIVALLGKINIGHFIPDYTAYEELLSTFNQFNSIPIVLKEENAFKLTSSQLEEEITDRGLKAILFSNPANPTSAYINQDELKSWHKVCTSNQCTMIADEFYSHYLYNQKDRIASIAQHIEDVNQDPVIILNGLTKNWHCPGWRIGWIVAPETIIESASSAGSFLDGGANQPLQHAALELLKNQDHIAQATKLQTHFQEKRDYLLTELKKLNIIPTTEVNSGFYVWAKLSHLPKPLRNGLDFFKEGIKEKVITVPGVFFDINPGQRRIQERFTQYCRISFGPGIEELKRGVASIKKMIEKFS